MNLRIDIVTELGQNKSASAGPDDGNPQYTPTPFPLDLAPAATVRVFDDSREMASAGFSAAAVDPTKYPISFHAEVLHPSAIGSLVVPDDLQRFRFNVGLRTLFSGATLSIIVRDSTGKRKRGLTREYLPMWFEQVDVATFTGGPVEPNDSISVRVVFGSAIVYGSRADNSSNDASFELVRAEWFSPITQ